MLHAAQRRSSLSALISSRFHVRHMVRAIVSRRSNPTFSRPQQATTLLSATLLAFLFVAFFLYKPPSNAKNVMEVSTAMSVTQFSNGSAISAGVLAAAIASPLVNLFSYLFVLTGRLKLSVIDSTKYGKQKWRPTSVYSLLWLPSILYAFAVLVCVTCSFTVLLYGSKMDGSGGLMWTIGCFVSMFTESIIIRPIFCVLEAGWIGRGPPNVGDTGSLSSPRQSQSPRQSPRGSR